MSDTYSDKIEPRYAMLASFWALGTVAALIVIKSYAYWLSDSAAILATLTDSFTDAAMSLAMLGALRYSLRPADRSHRHGHGKMEGIGALFQAACLIGAALFLAFEGLQRFAQPQNITHHTLGLWVAGIAIVLSIILVSVQKYCLSKAPSLATESDQAHYSTDIALNGSVAAALLADYYGGPQWVDPLCAIMVALYYAYAARKIALKATDMLTDRELPEAVRTRIKDIIKRHPDILGFHDLRTRKSGMVIHISFDVEIDPELTLREAHGIVRALEQDIISDFPYAEIIIHKDPYGDTHDTRHTNTVGERH
jgi:ferrous-iron efflux pump FieF